MQQEAAGLVCAMKKPSHAVASKTPQRTKRPARRPKVSSHPPKRARPVEPFRPMIEIITPLPPVGFAGSEPAGPAEMQRVRLGFFEPDAQEVFVVGSFNNWNPRATPLVRESSGDWSIELFLPPGQYRYRMMVDGEWRDDPAARITEAGPFGSCNALIIV